jgi:protein phosphatase
MKKNVELARLSMNLTIPEFALVVLVGVSGSGKSTFARKDIKPIETCSRAYKTQK